MPLQRRSTLVTYYYTDRHIFAVANGLLASVLGFERDECPVSLIGSKLVCGMADDLEPVPLDKLEPGHRLKFGFGDSCLITDTIIRIETARSLSVPPDSDFAGRPSIPTLPEIKLPRPPEDD
jgi:hypothetical protein